MTVLVYGCCPCGINSTSGGYITITLVLVDIGINIRLPCGGFLRWLIQPQVTLEEIKESEARGFSLTITLCIDEVPAGVCIISSAPFQKDSSALEHYQKMVNRFLERLETLS